MKLTTLLFAALLLAGCGFRPAAGSAQPTPTPAAEQSETAKSSEIDALKAEIDELEAALEEAKSEPTATPPRKDSDDESRPVSDPRGTTVQVAREGELVSAGTLVVLRYVDHSEMIIDVQGGPLTEDLIAGPNGLIAYDLWYNYGSESHAERDACKQALADLATTDDENSWNYDYQVTFHRLDVESECE